ncbi:MAG: hypothetical protein ACREA0_22270 [bacterium]
MRTWAEQARGTVCRVTSSRRWRLLLTACLGGSLLVGMLAGCSSTREVTRSPRGGIEQLLLSQSVERSLTDLMVPKLAGTTVFIESDGLTGDQPLVRAMLRDHLGQQQVLIRERKEDATYVAKVTVHSIGTELADTLFGMPATSSVILPIALPELAIYKVVRQKGYARYSVDVYEQATGRLALSFPWRAGSAYYNYYTVLFFLSFPATDLVLPPIPDRGTEQNVVGQPKTFLEDQPEAAYQESPGTL